MTDQPPARWRPLTTGDVAYALRTQPDYLKKWIKKGVRYGIPVCPPRWVTTADQRLWAWGDLERWATEHGVALRPLDEIEARAERRRALLGWQLAGNDR